MDKLKTVERVREMEKYIEEENVSLTTFLRPVFFDKEGLLETLDFNFLFNYHCGTSGKLKVFQLFTMLFVGNFNPWIFLLIIGQLSGR